MANLREQYLEEIKPFIDAKVSLMLTAMPSYALVDGKMEMISDGLSPQTKKVDEQYNQLIQQIARSYGVIE